MRGQFDLRKGDLGRRRLVLVLERPHMAAAVPGKAEILTLPGDAVEFLRRLVVAHAVHLVVGEPQFSGARIEVDTD